MAYSPVATLGFVATNGNKVANGDWTRYPVLGGQCLNAAGSAVAAGAKANQMFANIVQRTSTAADNLAKSDKVFNGVSKTVKFLRKNINPMIVASGVTKVALAKKEDREKTFYSEGGMIAGMFLGEGWMKKHMDKVVLSKLPVSKKWMPVVKGTLFVAGSLTSSAIGQKLGKMFFNNIEKSRAEKKEKLEHQLSQSVNHNETHQSEKSIDIKA